MPKIGQNGKTCCRLVKNEDDAGDVYTLEAIPQSVRITENPVTIFILLGLQCNWKYQYYALKYSNTQERRYGSTTTEARLLRQRDLSERL